MTGPATLAVVPCGLLGWVGLKPCRSNNLFDDGIDMGASRPIEAQPRRNKCAHPRARRAWGKGWSTSMASIRCLGRAGALLGLCLPHTVASAWLGDRRSSSSLPLSFGYALPSRSAYSPLSFYPPNAPPPPEETHFAEAVEAARQARVRRMERYPAFPETPTALAREISGGWVGGHE